MKRSGFLLCAGILAAGLLSGCGGTPVVPQGEVARPVRLLRVTSAEGTDIQRSFAGRVLASNQAVLAFRVSGPLVELPVKEGQAIAEGDLVARIDPRDFQTRLENARSDLEAARADLQKLESGERSEDIALLEANVSAARAEATRAEAEFRRLSALFEKGAVSAMQRDNAQASMNSAKAALDAVNAQLLKGESGARPEEIGAARARVDGLGARVREAENALADTELKAPFSGLVARRLVENFQVIQAQSPVVELHDRDSVDVEVQIPQQAYARRVSREDLEQIVVVIDSLPGREFPATIQEFRAVADEQTQTYAVRLRVPLEEGVNIAPGMSAEARIRLKRSGEAGEGFLIPGGSLFTKPDGTVCVWVADPADMAVAERPVQTGPVVSDGVLVKGGLSEGDLIAVSGVNSLRAGMLVRLMDESAR